MFQVFKPDIPFSLMKRTKNADFKDANKLFI